MIEFKKKGFFILIRNRYLALPRILRLLLVLSFFVIVITEFYLKQFPAEFFFQEAFGVFALNLSYSYLAGFVLYYIVVFDSLEKKKIASHRILNNRILAINMAFRATVESLYFASRSDKKIKWNEEFDLHNFERSCILIDPKSKCLMHSGFLSQAKEYDNWHDALLAKTNEIKVNIDIIMNYSDCIDSDLLILISGVRDEIETYFNIEFNRFSTAPDLTILGRIIYDLHQETNLIVKMFGERHIKAYDSQYHFLYRNLYKRNNVN